MKIPHKTLERNLFKSGYKSVIGVDEVGMGCLAGPVVVCAVQFTPEFYRASHRKLQKLRDSKLLVSHHREEFAQTLWVQKNIHFKLAYCFPKTIDRINIYQAARLAMRRAIHKLHSQFTNLNSHTMILVDGPHKINGLSHEQMPIIKGDRKVFAIACASIIAKVYRDRMMARYAKRYPGYGFEIHKGYGTKLHREKIKEHGPTPLHRRSFRWK